VKVAICARSRFESAVHEARAASQRVKALGRSVREVSLDDVK